MDFINALPGAVAQGLIWGIMAIGLYITYKILDIADLTVDGTICTGGAVCVMLIINGVNPWIAILCAALAGALAGIITGLFHVFMGIPSILSGILTQLILWSVNLKIMGQAQQSLNRADPKLLSMMNTIPAIMVGVAFCAAIIVILWLFFYTEVGLTLKSTGDNESMSKAQGVNVGFNKVLGLAISNALVALSGALLAQYQGYADISMGRGAIVIGLAAIIIGLSVSLKIKPNFVVSLIGVTGGAIAYYIVYSFVIWLGLDTDLLKMLSALVVAIFLAFPYWKNKYLSKSKKYLQEDPVNGGSENA